MRPSLRSKFSNNSHSFFIPASMIQAQNKEITFSRKSMHISTNFIFLLVIVLSMLSPTTKAQQPEYLYHFCPDNTTSTMNSGYRANRDILLNTLSSNGIRENGFYNATAGEDPDMLYGLFLCRGDVSTSDCQSCITLAVNDISRLCSVETTAVIWYDLCQLRYSNRNIFSVVTYEPVVVSLINNRSVTVTGTEQDRSNQFILRVVNDTATLLRNEPAGAKRVAYKEVNISRFQILYTLAQCTPDLSVTDCDRCLRVAIEKLPTGQQLGGRSLNPSCNVRYEFGPFYNQTAVPAPPAPEEEKRSKSNRITILVASLSATFGLAVVSFSGFIIWRRKNSQEDRENSQEFQLLDLVHEHSRETLSRENMGKSEEFPCIQLDILHVATNNFSNENKLGEGGFGSVYKGTLADGTEIAVKRLSTTSSQGLVEFKNEVMLIARLQHKNLVRLLGCCLEKNEKLLVYEFMPNGSLDAFLFDSNLDVQLDWQKRLSIIKGIARGIMYLHEDSRLRIIHRDLKASNVLLDHNMNPKISDFGMARIFGDDKDEAKTKRLVGTYGYMAPEYAMRGLFSIKSDVFSFGVILLEIISGKKSNSFHHSEGGESLLTFAWSLWSKGEAMELIDPRLVPSCVASEVLRCIHIGLLCVQHDPANRPTMSSVIFMLASDCTITLPHPTEPAFFVGLGDIEPSEPISNDGVVSVNEVTISNISAR